MKDERTASWLLILSLIGYPLVGLLSSLLQLTREESSIPFRVLVLGLAGYVAARHCLQIRKWGRLGLLLAFWALYFTRLFWDWASDVPNVEDAVTFFVATLVLPAIAIGLAGPEAIAETPTAWRLTLFGGTVCTLAVVMNQMGLGTQDFIFVPEDRMAFDNINAISLGHVAVTTILAGLFVIRGARSWRRALPLAAVTIAIACLVSTGSRGPVVCLMTGVLMMSVMSGWWRRAVLRRHWKLLLLSLGATAAFVVLAFWQESVLLDRFSALSGEQANFQEDRSSAERLLMQEKAFDQFLDNPILGSAFVELDSLTYPHNPYLETLMAMGLVGFAFLLALTWRTIKRARAMVRDGLFLIPLILTQYVIGDQFSGSLWASGPTWVLIALAIGYQVVPRCSHWPPTRA